MNNIITWFIVLLLIGVGLLSLTNSSLEAQCVAKGGQVIARPGNVSFCLYPAK